MSRWRGAPPGRPQVLVERVAHLGRGGEAILGPRRQRLAADLHQRRRRVGPHRLQRRDLAARQRRQDLDLAHAVPQPPPAEHLEQHRADGEDVAAAIGVPGELLRRHVVGAPLEHAGLGLERRVARLGDAEVDDLGVPLEGEEDVVRADVAMHEAERLAVEAGELVRVVER